MKKAIYEYEFSLTIRGKRRTVQQSETSAERAKSRIRSKLPQATNIKLKHKFSYPHLEGGKKV
jgi:hypothetical protein